MFIHTKKVIKSQNIMFTRREEQKLQTSSDDEKTEEGHFDPTNDCKVR